MLRLACLAGLAVTPVFADSPEGWDTFRSEVAAACTSLVEGQGVVTVEVNPFGSEHYGAAIVTLSAEWGEDRIICIYDKSSQQAELTAPFNS